MFGIGRFFQAAPAATVRGSVRPNPRLAQQLRSGQVKVNITDRNEQTNLTALNRTTTDLHNPTLRILHGRTRIASAPPQLSQGHMSHLQSRSHLDPLAESSKMAAERPQTPTEKTTAQLELERDWRNAGGIFLESFEDLGLSFSRIGSAASSHANTPASSQATTPVGTLRASASRRKGKEPMVWDA